MRSRAESFVSSPTWGAGAERRAARHEGALRRLVGRVGAWARARGTAAAVPVASASWELPRDATVRLRPGRSGLAVRCRAGTLLVTQAGDPLDHVLSPGEEVTLGRRGLVVVWALTDAAIAAPASTRQA